MKRALVALLLFVAAAPLAAQSKPFELGLRHVIALTTGNESFDGGELDIRLSRGFGVTAELFCSERVSAHLSATFVQPEAILFPDSPPPEDVDLNTLSIEPIALLARYHFRSGARISPYVAGGVAFVQLGDLDDRFGVDIEASLPSQFAPAGEAGLRYRRGRAAIELSATYIPVSAELDVHRNTAPRVTLPEEVELNPIFIGGAISWRF